MSCDAKKVIHIGANKCASTTLQRSLFSKHKDIKYLGEDCDKYNDYKLDLNTLVGDDDFFYDKNKIEDIFAEKIKQCAGKTFIFSNEDIMTSKIPMVCAKRLKELIPDAAILLIIRNQYDAIPSFYINHGAFLKPAPSSYFRRHVEFDDWLNYEMTIQRYGAIAGFDYSKYETIFSSIFGRKLHILLFEDFINDKHNFIKKLAATIEIEADDVAKLLENSHERKRNSHRAFLYHKFRSNFFWGTNFSSIIPFGDKIRNYAIKFISKGGKASLKLSSSQHKQIFQRYGVSNWTLANKYGLDLEKYGYPLKNEQ